MVRIDELEADRYITTSALDGGSGLRKDRIKSVDQLH